ncbi:MAG: diphosphate--fructose-6-phosphate 1-phosphotransferase [Bacteroidales bacterium]|nr:diphosphate--fructose-6-phosphate 1-phosphotransferase [Bacteroidales bacterium]
MNKSPLQIARAAYQPKMPASIENGAKLVEGKATESVADQADIKKLFPNTYGLPIVTFEKADQAMAAKALNVGVILSGGQAPGGHNVISGIFDGIKAINKDSKLYGFLGGPSGLVDHKYIELTSDIIDEYRNTGGFDIIGSGRTKLEEISQFDKGLEICKKLNINAIVIIGGDDSNTNACVLAEYYKAKNTGIQVIGCPKTIDGDLKNEMIETSFGFDTATKVYSEVIGNIERDANSAKKYWHFIKLMGRSASHVTLECALKTQPNITLIGEEVEAKNQTLDDVVTYIANAVKARADKGLNFGTVLVPEGLIEFIPAIKKLIAELNDMLAANQAEFDKKTVDEKIKFIVDNLSKENSALFLSLPQAVSKQLALERDPHGNVQVSLIETEQLLAEMVAKKLAEWKKEGKFNGKFSTQHHFFGYEGRCAAPSNFDADYCYSLGRVAALLINSGKTGYMSSVRNTTKPASEWLAGGIPITAMMNMEKRSGKMKPVIQKALVKLDGGPFKFFASKRDEWAIETAYVYPGPIQYFGPSEVADITTETIKLEH